MTDLLQKAFTEASTLPDAEQDRLAKWLIAELESEQRWAKSFEDSQDLLSELADEALEELKAGLTLPLDPETL